MGWLSWLGRDAGSAPGPSDRDAAAGVRGGDAMGQRPPGGDGSEGPASPRPGPRPDQMQGDGLQSSRGDGSEGDPQEKRQLYYPNGQPIPKGPYEDMSDRAFRALVDSIISTNQRVRHIMQAMTKASAGARRRVQGVAVAGGSEGERQLPGAPPQLGCHVDKNFVQVEVCDEAVSGGYRPPDGVVLCKNHLSFEKDIATTMQASRLQSIMRAWSNHLALRPWWQQHRSRSHSLPRSTSSSTRSTRAERATWTGTAASTTRAPRCGRPRSRGTVTGTWRSVEAITASSGSGRRVAAPRLV